MTWFKVDDRFWSHPKVMTLSLEATGLWVRAGAWCAMHLTDGRIPVSIVERISPVSPRVTARIAGELQRAGLWTRDGDAWRFHQWDEHQPSRDRIEAERAANRERQARGRQRQRASRHASRRDTRDDEPRDTRRDSGGPDPTRTSGHQPPSPWPSWMDGPDRAAAGS